MSETSIDLYNLTPTLSKGEGAITLTNKCFYFFEAFIIYDT